LGHVGRFPGITVIADRIANSETVANANFSVARSEVDKEDRMTFESHNPATGELIGAPTSMAASNWAEVRLRPRAKAITYWTALYVTYVNWLFTVLAAVFGKALDAVPLALAWR
jgi:hypothetical protein